MPRGEGDPGRSPQGSALLKLVASNEAMTYKELVSQLAAHVPPGRAARAYERLLRISRSRQAREALTNVQGPRKVADPEDAVRMGQVVIARDLVWEWYKRRGYLERDPETDVIRPGPRWDKVVEGYRKRELKNGEG